MPLRATSGLRRAGHAKVQRVHSSRISISGGGRPDLQLRRQIDGPRPGVDCRRRFVCPTGGFQARSSHPGRPRPIERKELASRPDSPDPFLAVWEETNTKLALSVGRGAYKLTFFLTQGIKRSRKDTCKSFCSLLWFRWGLSAQITRALP